MSTSSPPEARDTSRELLSGWGRTPASSADIYRPGSGTEIGRQLDTCRSTWISRGMGRSYGDAALNAGGTVVDMTGLSGIRRIDLETGMVTVAAGLTLDTLLNHILPLGWFLPVTPGTRFVTIGGALAADVHGKNHHVDGSFQRYVESFELLTPCGECIHVDRETQPSLFAATAGGLGLTGFILEVTFSLLRVESAYMLVDRERAPNLETVLDRMLDSDDQYRYSVAWVDCLSKGRSLGRSVLMRGNHATLADLPASLREQPFKTRGVSGFRLPSWAGKRVIYRPAIAAFNELYYRNPAAAHTGVIEGLYPYFYPLDRIENWNTMYGGRGFIQYQFVIPESAVDALRTIFEELTAYPCSLAVLKRFGEGYGLLSFPMPGWTLAVDIPAGADGLAELLDRLDRLVVDAGGRVYLAKDARLQPQLLPAMYPELTKWRAIRREVDPDNRMRSDLAARLGLR